MILGDSLQVMASLAEREGLRGQVQCVYVDPPYGIRFNSNFQWSTTSRDVRDGRAEHITREPEQVRAFRDTWRDGVHSYLGYLRDRLTAVRDLLADSGSVFVQIGDENVHRVRAVMDEVFGPENFVVTLVIQKKGSQSGDLIAPINDYILWYGKNVADGGTKFRQMFMSRPLSEANTENFRFVDTRSGERISSQGFFALSDTDRTAIEIFRNDPLTSGHVLSHQPLPVTFRGRTFYSKHWKTAPSYEDGSPSGMDRLAWSESDSIEPPKSLL